MSEPQYDYSDIPARDPSKNPYPIDPKLSREIRTRYYTATFYQHEASRTLIDKPDFVLTEEQQMILWNIDGLAGEVGELMNIIKKAIWHQHGLTDDTRIKIKEEIGDAMWYIAALCTKMGFELGDVMFSNVEKLKKRHPNGWNAAETVSGRRADKPEEKYHIYDTVEDLERDLDSDASKSEAEEYIKGMDPLKGYKVRMNGDHYVIVEPTGKEIRITLDQAYKILSFADDDEVE